MSQYLKMLCLLYVTDDPNEKKQIESEYHACSKSIDDRFERWCRGE